MKQISKGCNNSNASYTISGNKIIFNFGENNIPVPLQVIWDYATSTLLSKEDAAINNRLPDRVTNKANITEEYDSSKIIRSLISVGVPLPCACNLAIETMKKVTQWIDEHETTSITLSTKTIRRFVSQALQELDVKHYSKADIEKWNTKYIRRYGRNNRAVEIYDIPANVYDSEIVEISYDFIRRTFLPDVLKATVPDRDYLQELAPATITSLSEDIIEFINSCDLYRIDYSLLKRMINEIATQPPHPWIVDDIRRLKIIAYDKDALKSNLKESVNYKENGRSIPYGIIIEILHHASSMVLEHYFSFLGNEDLSCFVQLKRCLEQITKPELSGRWEFILSEYVLNGIADDFSLAGISLRPYLANMEKIHDTLTESKERSSNFDSWVIKFAEESLIVSEYGNCEKVKVFLTKEWSTIDLKERNENIRTILRLLFPCNSIGEARNSNSFWMNYISCGTSSFPDWKNNVFVIVEGEGGFDFSVLNTLKKARSKSSCNNVFFITQNRHRTGLYKQIEDIFIEYELVDDYSYTVLDKQDFSHFIEHENRKAILDHIIKEEADMFS